MYFTINLAFTNYLDEMPNLMEQPPIDRGITVLVLTVHCTQGQVDLKILYKNTCRRIMLKKFLFAKKAYITCIITLQKILFK